MIFSRIKLLCVCFYWAFIHLNEGDFSSLLNLLLCIHQGRDGETKLRSAVFSSMCDELLTQGLRFEASSVELIFHMCLFMLMVNSRLHVVLSVLCNMYLGACECVGVRSVEVVSM
jgi:hypothetical protein